MEFAADLDLLWPDRTVADGIRAAAAAGFTGVEFGAVIPAELDATLAAVAETEMQVLAITTAPGVVSKDEIGLAAVAGREGAASLAIDQAIAQAVTLEAQAVHVTAGRGDGDPAFETWIGNLEYACAQATLHGLRVLIGPQNRRDTPGAFVHSLEQCTRAIEELGHPALRLMFDCYEVSRCNGDLTGHLEDLMPLIGQIRIAGVPDRGTPDRGEVNFAYVLRVIEGLEWTAPVSASYRPRGRTDHSLAWMRSLRPAVIRPWQLAACAAP